MVGTFYTSPNPDSPTFVEVGAKVDPDTVVCIIEAMKIFNEIKAECSGTIQKILVKNSESVEFGQPLFLVKPD
jgi:acetyl-CoA carboxylase biotin carboxyl carrier protein